MAVWGSVQKGKAARFSSKGKADQPGVSQAALETPAATQAFQGLQVGPDFEIEYGDNSAQSIDGSNSLLRVLSPFMIQVELPLIVGSNPSTDKKDYAGVFDSAHRNAPSAWKSGRDRYLQNIAGGPQLSMAGSVEQFVSDGMQVRQAGGGQIREVPVSADSSGSARLGTPAIADLRTAVDVEMQLRAIVQTEPLVLLINPQSLSMSYSKVQQFSDRTRYGFVFQAWGEEQPKISISAKCGAFISGGRGVQFASRLDSASWQNVQSAFHFYRHNGYIYDTVGKSNAHHMIGALSIHYDGWVYYGNMESFTYTLDESNQLGGIAFEMEFVVSSMVDTSKQSMIVSPMRSPIPSRSDPRYSGARNRARPSEGDRAVNVGEVISTGLSVGAQGSQGFVSEPSAVSVALPSRRLAPFRVGRR